MKTLMLTATTALLAFTINGQAHANTNLIVNSDTGAQVHLDANDNLIGVRNAAPEDNGYTSADASVGVSASTSTQADVDSDNTDNNASVENETDAEVSASIGDPKDELEAKAQAVQEQASDSMQDLEDRTNSGVQATATTKIDMR